MANNGCHFWSSSTGIALAAQSPSQEPVRKDHSIIWQTDQGHSFNCVIMYTQPCTSRVVKYDSPALVDTIRIFLFVIYLSTCSLSIHLPYTALSAYASGAGRLWLVYPWTTLFLIYRYLISENCEDSRDYSNNLIYNAFEQNKVVTMTRSENFLPGHPQSLSRKVNVSFAQKEKQSNAPLWFSFLY